MATGVVVDQATGYPGYNSVIPRDTVAIGEILRQNGYDTSWFGKDHNVPQWVASQAGPFTDWPTGPIKGFDYYYGFIGDDTSQWQPNNLFRNTTPIEPYLGNPGWNLITAMADEAIGRIKMLNEVQPDRPFMIYYAPGGTHAPHHPTKEWVEKISDMHLFDEGWNKLREHDLRQPEEARRRSRRMPSSRPGRTICRSGTRSSPRRRSSTSARPMSTRRISPIPTMRSAA